MVSLFLSALLSCALAAFLPVPGQAVEQLLVGSRCRRYLVDNDNVQAGEFVLMLPERLPDDSLYSVPARGVPAVLLGNCQPQPGDVLIVVSTKHGKPFVSTSRGFFEHARERRRIE